MELQHRFWAKMQALPYSNRFYFSKPCPTKVFHKNNGPEL
jgi:hypothetical protein